MVTCLYRRSWAGEQQSQATEGRCGGAGLHPVHVGALCGWPVTTRGAGTQPSKPASASPQSIAPRSTDAVSEPTGNGRWPTASPAAAPGASGPALLWPRPARWSRAADRRSTRRSRGAMVARDSPEGSWPDRQSPPAAAGGQPQAHQPVRRQGAARRITRLMKVDHVVRSSPEGICTARPWPASSAGEQPRAGFTARSVHGTDLSPGLPSPLRRGAGGEVHPVHAPGGDSPPTRPLPVRGRV